MPRTSGVRLAALAALVASAVGALTGAGEDGKPGRLDGTTTYFKKSTITISGLTGDCMTRLNARKGKFSYSPGTYAAYAEGDGNIPDDDDLEDYNSGWKLSTGATVSYSDLPDGYFFFTASCTSPYTTSDDFMFKIDTVSPTSEIVPTMSYDPSGSDATAYTARIAITDTYGAKEYDEPLSTPANQPHHYKWRVDEGDWTMVLDTGVSSMLDFSHDYDVGPHCLEVNALDAAHNTEHTASIYCWTVESFTQYTGCTFRYSVNGAEFTSTAAASVDMADLPDGTNSVAVYATDVYGNHDSALTNTFTWTIDTVKPTVSVPVETSGRGASHSSATFKYEASDVDSFYKYQVDGGAIIAVPASVAFTNTHSTTLHRGTFPATSCSGTTHTFSVHAVDAVGNVGAASTYSFLVDPVETTLTLVNALAGNTVAGSTAEFQIGAIVDGQTEHKGFGYQYMVDAGAWITGKHFPQFGVRGLEEGLHTVTARAISEDGCTDYSPVTAVVSVDYTAPETIMHCPPPLVNETSFTIYGVVEDDSIKTSGSEFKLGDAPYMPTTAVAADGSFSLVLTDLTEGPYSLKVKSTDNAGHTGEEAICSFVIDQTIPDTLITMGPNSPMMLDEMAGFVFACPGETRCEYMYSFDGADYKPVETPSFRCKGLGYHKCVAGPVKAGMHTMMVYAVDAAGNADPTPAAFSFSVFDEVGYQEFASFASFTVVGNATPKSGKTRDINKVWGLAAEASGPVDPYAGL